jgi:GNAT superfamily N-acetyltransferase
VTRGSSHEIGLVRVRARPETGEPALEAATFIRVMTSGLDDAPGLVGAVSEAFAADPTWSWAFPDPARRRLWLKLCVDNALRYPWTFRTAGFEAVSVWIPPGGSEFSPEDEEKVPGILAELAGERVGPVTELLRRFEEAHPRVAPHYYLSLLGTRDAHRGRGVGMALLEENLARIDAEHAPAYLESSNPANDSRYRALGFKAVARFNAPGGGPAVTGMWRTAR